MKTLIFFILCFVSFSANSYSSILQENLKAHVEFLASDSLEGRKAGTTGGRKAAEYIAQEFKSIGLKKFNDTYYDNFVYTNAHARNVIGIIRASNPKYKDEYIVLGAHYDHLGFTIEPKDTYVGELSENDKLKVGKKEIISGADDNASGTAAIIELAKMLMQNKDKLSRDIIIVAFDGEEDGLLGSRHFVNNPPVELSKIKAVLNLDMIGRMKDNSIYYSGFGSFEGGDDFAKSITKEENLRAYFLDHSSMWRDRSDHGPFYRNQIPGITGTTGEHNDYHTSRDNTEKINFEGLEKICYQSYNIILALASKEEYIFEETSESVKVNLKSYQYGLSLDYSKSSFQYSEGPFDGKTKLGGGIGLFLNKNLSKRTTLLMGAKYRFARAHSFKGDLNLHSVEIPVKLAYGSPQFNYMPFRVYFFIGADLEYSFGGKLDGESIDWANMGINQFRSSVNLGMRIELYNIYFESYFYNKPITPFFKVSDEASGKARLSNNIVGFGFAF